MEITVPSLESLPSAAKRFVGAMDGHSVFAFYGKMGAGKTTFIKAVCEELGVEDVITSPTFAIINEYTAADGRAVYHFDCYRLRRTEEFEDIGGEDYFYSGGLCFIEWPDIIESVLPPDAVSVKIEESTDGGRLISF